MNVMLPNAEALPYESGDSRSELSGACVVGRHLHTAIDVRRIMPVHFAEAALFRD